MVYTVSGVNAGKPMHNWLFPFWKQPWYKFTYSDAYYLRWQRTAFSCVLRVSRVLIEEKDRYRNTHPVPGGYLFIHSTSYTQSARDWLHLYRTHTQLSGVHRRPVRSIFLGYLVPVQCNIRLHHPKTVRVCRLAGIL